MSRRRLVLRDLVASDGLAASSSIGGQHEDGDGCGCVGFGEVGYGTDGSGGSSNSVQLFLLNVSWLRNWTSLVVINTV